MRSGFLHITKSCGLAEHMWAYRRLVLVLVSNATFDSHRFRSLQSFLTESKWVAKLVLVGGSQLGTASSKRWESPNRLQDFNRCMVIFMYIAYVDGSSPVELDPQTLSRRCGIRRWLLSILTYSNAWPILAKSSQRNNGWQLDNWMCCIFYVYITQPSEDSKSVSCILLCFDSIRCKKMFPEQLKVIHVRYSMYGSAQPNSICWRSQNPWRFKACILHLCFHCKNTRNCSLNS
jgi:hypothetical protein